MVKLSDLKSSIQTPAPMPVTTMVQVPIQMESSGLDEIVNGYTVRAKVHGIVIVMDVRPEITPAELQEKLRGMDASVEFDTEMRREFSRGELKHGAVQMVTVEGRNDKVMITAIGTNGDGSTPIKADAWMEKDKAVELLRSLDLSEAQATSVQRGIDGQDNAVLMVADRNVGMDYRESEKDGKTRRVLVEFHTGGSRS